MKALTKSETIERLKQGETLFAHYHRGTLNRTSYALSGVYNRVSPKVAEELIDQKLVVHIDKRTLLDTVYKWSSSK